MSSNPRTAHHNLYHKFRDISARGWGRRTMKYLINDSRLRPRNQVLLVQPLRFSFTYLMDDQTDSETTFYLCRHRDSAVGVYTLLPCPRSFVMVL